MPPLPSRCWVRTPRSAPPAKTGETVALGRLEKIHSGETLSAEKAGGTQIKAPEPPEPVYGVAIGVKDRKDEVKLTGALARLMEEDPSLRLEHAKDTHQMVLWGQGEMHLRVALERLKRKYGVEAVSKAAPGALQGDHQEGHRDPRPAQEAVGRSRAVRRRGARHQAAAARRWIQVRREDHRWRGAAPVHPVGRDRRVGLPAARPARRLSGGGRGGDADSTAPTTRWISSDMAFRQAGRIAMVEGMPKCAPVLLEPIMEVEIAIPSDATARVNGMIPQRRGQILGFDAREGWPGWDLVRAQLPELEMADLIVELRSATAGVGTFTAKFHHLAELTGGLRTTCCPRTRPRRSSGLPTRNPLTRVPGSPCWFACSCDNARLCDGSSSFGDRAETKMDADDLRIFEAVARTGAMSRAALELNTVQSNVTGRIKALEDRLGAVLFERTNRGVALTAAGTRLVPFARRVSSLLEDARRAVSDEGLPVGSLVVGSLETTVALRLAPLLAEFGAAHPMVDLSLKTGTSCELVEQVRDRRLDGAFVCGPVEHPDLLVEPFFTEEVVVLSAPTIKDFETLAAVPNLRIVVLRSGCSYRLCLEALLAKRGVVGVRVLEFATLEAIVSCVSAGLGITLLPRSLVGQVWKEGRVAVHPLLQGEGRVETVFIRHHDAYATAALRAFLALVRPVLAGAEAAE